MDLNTMFEQKVNEPKLADIIDKALADFRFGVADMEAVQGLRAVLVHLREGGARILTGAQVQNLHTTLQNLQQEVEHLRGCVREAEVAMDLSPPASLASSNGGSGVIDCGDLAPAETPERTVVPMKKPKAKKTAAPKKSPKGSK